MSLRERIVYHALRIMRAISLRLSDRSAARLGSRIGNLIFHHFPFRRKVALQNLERAFPRANGSYYDRLIKLVYVHFGRILVDTLRVEGMDLEKAVIVENRGVLDAAIAEDGGMILLSGHFGNWEIIPVWFARNGYKLFPVAKRQKNKGTNQFLVELRRRTDTFPLYPNAPAREMIRILRNGHILALASDQDARKRGVFVSFLGTPASTPKGAAVLHMKTRAPIIMCICRLKKDGTYNLKFARIPTNLDNGDPVVSITQRFSSYLEDEIRKQPEQYFWFHRRWKTKPKT